MKSNYLIDTYFLKTLDSQKVQERYAKIILLNWEEQPLQEFTGQVLGGSINIDGKSNLRRTANLNTFIPIQDHIEQAINLFSINKKVTIEIGYKNNLKEQFPQYQNLDIIWFPMGLYVITQKSIVHNLNGLEVSLQLKDKMCLLNGECGGVIPASVNFSEMEILDSDGNAIIKKPTLYQIIQETVHHWGGEQLGKIIINDLDTRIRQVMKWTGKEPIYCYKEFEWENMSDHFAKTNGTVLTLDKTGLEDNYQIPSNSFNVLFSLNLEEKFTGTRKYWISFAPNQDIGYINTDFVYPGKELIGEIGSSVCDLLDKIKNLLGNYEYFYDIKGNFIFQEIKNYLNTSHSTIVLNDLKNKNYLVDQTKGRSIYNFDDSTLITTYNNNPNFNMIKNDFVVWGMKKNLNGNKIPIRYHLAIDNKPNIKNIQPHSIIAYQDKNSGLTIAKSYIKIKTEPTESDIGQLGIIYQYENNGKYKYYEYTINNTWKELENIVSQNVQSADWRTELYLQGVEAEVVGYYSNDYYVELKNEWPKLYNIWADPPGFNFCYQTNPSDCDYFLDFIDTSSPLNEFSIQNIGRRTKTIVDDTINCIFAPDIPNIYLLLTEGKFDSQTEQLRDECDRKGLEYIQVSKEIYNLLAPGGYWNSAFDMIKNLLYQYTSYNESISLQCVPIYHLDANTCISVSDFQSQIFGEYMITNLSIPLDISGTMTINAIKRMEKI